MTLWRGQGGSQTGLSPHGYSGRKRHVSHHTVAGLHSAVHLSVHLRVHLSVRQHQRQRILTCTVVLGQQLQFDGPALPKSLNGQ